ncbi:MAG: DUF5788 family protein [Halanaeroarchaeum sp.]
MKDYERKQLLERVGREGATIGFSIPETVEIDGESFELRAFVMKTKRLETTPPDHRERVESVKKSLRFERTERYQRLQHESMSASEGERLAEEIVGIDRALEALQSHGDTDVAAEARAAQTADQKRWLSFLKRALGHDDEDSGPGART